MEAALHYRKSNSEVLMVQICRSRKIHPRVGAIGAAIVLISICGCQPCMPPIMMNRAHTYPCVRIRGGVERSNDMETFLLRPLCRGCNIGTRGYDSREGRVLTNPAYHFKRIGLKARPLSQWHLISPC